MADDTREPDSSEQPAAAGTVTAPGPPPPAKPGVILGKDGKPCRPCMSFAAFTSQSKAAKSGATATPTTTTTTTTSSSAAAATEPLRECPADVETLGRGTWTLLHTIAATYPTSPTAAQQADVTAFMDALSRLYPCWFCAKDLQAFVGREGVRAGSRDELGNWLCRAHNEVNRKLGKPVFNCSRWEERWRTGWKDGSCD